jgi:hypothetical protein
MLLSNSYFSWSLKATLISAKRKEMKLVFHYHNSTILAVHSQREMVKRAHCLVSVSSINLTYESDAFLSFQLKLI